MWKYIIVWCSTLMTPAGENPDPKNSVEVDGKFYKIEDNCRNKIPVDTKAEAEDYMEFLKKQSKNHSVKLDSVKIKNQ